MSHRIDWDGIVYDLDTSQRIGVVDKGRGGILLDEDVYRDDGRYDCHDSGTTLPNEGSR